MSEETKHIKSLFEKLSSDLYAIEEESLIEIERLQAKCDSAEKVIEAAKNIYMNSQEFYWSEEDGTYHAAEVDDIHDLAEALSTYSDLTNKAGE